MPTEAALTRSFLKQLRYRYPKAVVFKFNDRTTSGLPDSCVTFSGHTVWLEFKRDKPALTDLQRVTLGRLHAASGGRALVVVFCNGLVNLYTFQQPHSWALTVDEAITAILRVAEAGQE